MSATVSTRSYRWLEFSGRPARHNSELRRIITFVDEATHRRLVSLANGQGISLAEVVRRHLSGVEQVGLAAGPPSANGASTTPRVVPQQSPSDA